MKATRGRDGFSLVSALFVLVVLAVVSASMLGVAAAQRRSSSFALLGTRAYQAARSGIEWAVASAIATPGSCPAAAFTLDEGGLTGFSVLVTCASSQHEENGAVTTVFRFTSEARYGSFGDDDYASRRIEATVSAGP